jgi:GNAT superfamily N-acetyltransferase
MTQYPPELITLAIAQRLPARHLEPDDQVVQRKTIGIELHVDGDPVEIGRMEVVILDFETLSNERVSLFDACDAHSKPLNDWALAIFDENEHLIQDVSDAIELDIVGSGTAYVDTLFIEPAYRGSRLGLAALHAFVRYGCLGCSSVFLKAHPLVKEGVAHPGELEHDKGRAKLRELYSSIGFTRIGTSGYMGLNLEYIAPDFPG